MPNVGETEYRLDEVVRATIGADGTATQTNIGPKAANERWEIENTSVSGTATAKLQVFRGNDGVRQIDATVTAELDSSDTKIPLRNGEVVSYKWTGGTVGAQMLVSLQGTRYVRGVRAY